MAFVREGLTDTDRSYRRGIKGLRGPDHDALVPGRDRAVDPDLREQAERRGGPLEREGRGVDAVLACAALEPVATLDARRPELGGDVVDLAGLVERGAHEGLDDLLESRLEGWQELFERLGPFELRRLVVQPGQGLAEEGREL